MDLSSSLLRFHLSSPMRRVKKIRALAGTVETDPGELGSYFAKQCTFKMAKSSHGWIGKASPSFGLVAFYRRISPSQNHGKISSASGIRIQGTEMCKTEKRTVEKAFNPTTEMTFENVVPSVRQQTNLNDVKSNRKCSDRLFAIP